MSLGTPFAPEPSAPDRYPHTLYHWHARYPNWLAALLIPLLLTLVGASAVPVQAAPLRQDETYERWVDGVNGSDSNNCTRSVNDNDTEDDTDDDFYEYKSCQTITRALSAAKSGDIIRVAGQANYIGSITVDKSITIIGGYAPGFGNLVEPPTNPTAYPTTISGSGGTSTVLILGPDLLVDPNLLGVPLMEVTLKGVRITGGGSASGGGGGVRIGWGSIRQRATVTLDTVTVYSNNGGSTGGGIYITGSGNHLDLIKSVVQQNSATNGAGLYITGSSTATLSDDTVI